MKQHNQFMVGDLVKYSNPEDNYREHICEIDTVFSKLSNVIENKK